MNGPVKLGYVSGILLVAGILIAVSVSTPAGVVISGVAGLLYALALIILRRDIEEKPSTKEMPPHR